MLKDRNYKINVLKLDSNKITDHCVNIICESLIITSNKHLKVLSLGENLITDAGCIHFAEMLDINSTNLKELRLNWNSIKA